MRVDAFLERLDRVRATGQTTWAACCPAHDDRVASLSIRVGDDDRVLVHCHTGCSPLAVVDALHLNLADLFATDSRPIVFAKPGVLRIPAARTDSLPRFLPRAQPVSPTVTEETIARYALRLQSHTQLLERVHTLKGWSPETLDSLKVGFDGRRLTLPVRAPGGTLIGLLRYQPAGEPKMLAGRGTPRELWPAPESLPGGPLFIVEGEPDAISARELGLSAVALPGAGKWRASWVDRLADRTLVMVSDCDEPGRIAAARFAANLAEHADVRVVDLDPSRSDGHDLGDELTAARDDFARRQLRRRLLELAGLDPGRMIHSAHNVEAPAPLTRPGAWPKEIVAP